MPTRVFLKQNRRKRLEQGHPWIYQSEVDHIEDKLSPGQIVHVVNHKGVFLAQGYANPNSQMIVRVLGYDENEQIDEDFFYQKILHAKLLRARFLPDADSYRAVYGEADFLPGLIVDKYGDVLVVQILSFGMEVMKDMIKNALIKVYNPKGIYLRNDVPVRKIEGLPLETLDWYGDIPGEIEIIENGLRFMVDVREGQKTGYFFDQRENRQAISPLMRGYQSETRSQDGADILECFCHTGAFAVHAANYGAHKITAIDISEEAIQVAKRNAQLNGFAEKIHFQAANAFDFLREQEQLGAQYDVVLLDPPAFAKSKRALTGAIRGYKEINLRGMKLVRDGGFLITASCSFHMSPEMFRATILDAAVDAHKVLRLLHWSSAGYDHPEIEGVSEGHYLKFAIYEVTSR
jgi:23S rRNA (cytosine1962-C5)-methyltransferase